MYSLLTPKTDFVFKKIFSSDKSILVAFLNAILYDCENKIASVELKNSEDSTLSIKAFTENKKTVNIEIKVDNNSSSSNLIEQSMYYWSKAYESQISSRDHFYKLNKVIYINIKDFHSIYRLGNINGTDELSDLFEIQFLEIPKLRELNPNDSNSTLEIWTEFLRNPESQAVKKAELNNIELKKAKQELYKITNQAKS